MSTIIDVFYFLILIAVAHMICESKYTEMNLRYKCDTVK